MRFYLGGGGSEHDEAALWDEAFSSGQGVSIWPFAMAAGAARTGSVQWLSNALRGRGDFTIDPWGLDDTNSSPEDSMLRLRGSDVLAIPGGNTFDLLQHLQQRQLLQVVLDFLAGGGRVYGGSAGAILFGADIAMAELADPNDAGLTDLAGLDLLAGAVVLPHYRPSQDAEVQQWVHQRGRTIIALPERSGVAVADWQARNVGPDPVRIFTPDGEQHTHESGSSWRLTDL
ncbi:Type 1 glutamine amidotransferase-like domain-containing protein [Arthrobacter castelli]|uniref:Type 1 glutamine amidotransferase-like domain-containing protein n=1 Tax=Arthrobacter castelli TaxID=271431 RepID=UPI0006891D4F|nr:Type 1 glutamine amidotransferase-like domain-containing protein [Arthrobacter castelli]